MAKKRAEILSAVYPSEMLEDERPRASPKPEERSSYAQIQTGPIVDTRDTVERVADVFQPLLAVLAFITRSTVDGFRGLGRLGRWAWRHWTTDHSNCIPMDADRRQRLLTGSDRETTP